MKKKILVIGAEGQVGRGLQKVASHFSDLEFLFTGTNMFDITDREGMKQYFFAHQPSVVINCAGYTAVDKAEQEIEKARLINATGVENLAMICAQFDVPLIHLSTDFVFDGSKKTPYLEIDIPHPLSMYGQTKLEGEQLALKHHDKVIILRTSWIYSAWGTNFVKTILRLSTEQSELRIVNDQWGSPTYARDLVTTLITLAEKCEEVQKWGIYHYSNQGAITWYEFAKAILEIKKIATPIIPISSEELSAPAHRPAYSALDCRKIQQVFDVPLYDWKERLESCLGNDF